MSAPTVGVGFDFVTPHIVTRPAMREVHALVASRNGEYRVFSEGTASIVVRDKNHEFVESAAYPMVWNDFLRSVPLHEGWEWESITVHATGSVVGIAGSAFVELVELL